MSRISVADKRGGRFEVAINFTYGECERLPFNVLREFGARIGVIPHGGVQATAEFNVRNPSEAASFIELLELFGDGGSFVHGSATEPSVLVLAAPPLDTQGRATLTPKESLREEVVHEEEADAEIEIENEDVAADLIVEEDAVGLG